MIEAGMIMTLDQHFATQAALNLLWRPEALRQSLTSVMTRMLRGAPADPR